MGIPIPPDVRARLAREDWEPFADRSFTFKVGRREIALLRAAGVEVRGGWLFGRTLTLSGAEVGEMAAALGFQQAREQPSRPTMPFVPLTPEQRRSIDRNYRRGQLIARIKALLPPAT